jgi:hypothetical protein
MVSRTWRNLLIAALGMGVLAATGQLGIAFSFGIVQLTGVSTGATVNQWPAQLAWVGWFAAHAAVAGTVVTARLARRYGVLETGRLVAIAAAAALGATVIAPLCVRPAQAADRLSVDPIWALGICAIVGALVGAGAAIAVLLKPPLGWNMAAVSGAVWLLALIPVVPALATAGPLPAVRIGVLEQAGLDANAAHRQALLILPAVALLVGAATGGLARWRRHPRLVNGATGATGPLLIAFAYLTAGPGGATDRYQITPYYGALLAVAAGVLGSAAAALFRWPFLSRTSEERVVEPTDILRPLSDPAVPHAMTPATGAVGEPAPVDLVGTGRFVSVTAATHASTAEPLGYGALADSATRTAAPSVTATSGDLATRANLATQADFAAPETSQPALATAAGLSAGPGGDRSGTAGADNTEPDRASAAPGTRRLYEPPKADRTRVRAAQPVVPARWVPSSTGPAPRAEATHSTYPQDSADPALPPRHRPPVPNMDQAANWDALANARRAGTLPTADTAQAGPVGAIPVAAVPTPATPASVVRAERTSERAGARLGLFRRNRSRADAGGAGSRPDGEPLPRQDAEFVDWVSRLGRPVVDSEPARRGPHGSLHSTSRHHGD